MSHLTVRNVPSEVIDALRGEKQRRGTSLNQTVIDLLRQSLGTPDTRRRNGLRRFAGTWDDKDLAEFEQAIAVTEEIDEEMWK